ncbi:hypothetical protein AGMMS50262_09270 [Bacteroidia bacterium]|nr:hypothetical protein AGMMS50262_09270 [Bacteroidia bacterium]
MILFSEYQRIWKKCNFDIGLKGVFSFDFGKTVENNLPVGDLRTFEFYMDGHLNIDLLLKYVFTAKIEESKENLIKKDVLPVAKFRFMVGNVPVIIFVYTHLYKRYELAANSEITMSAGCYLQANAKLGLNYTKDAGVSPIMSFNSDYGIYGPTFHRQRLFVGQRLLLSEN